MTAGLGSQPLGSFALGGILQPPDESQPTIVTSRKIDHVLRKYVFGANGDYLPMGDTASRVILLVAFAVKPTKFVTPNQNATSVARIRTALSPLTSSRPPDARIKDILVTNPRPGCTRIEVVFVDLAVGGVASEPVTAAVEVAG